MAKFQGFNEPKENWSKLPHQLINELPRFSSLAELKVVLYTLRHTWGYHDDYKKITLDEFENGRKERDGSRIDDGVGMAKPSIIDGIKRAIEDEFLFVYTDDSDTARVKKFYSLTDEGLKSFTPDVKEFYPCGKDSLHRTEKETEKETKEKNFMVEQEQSSISDNNQDDNSPNAETVPLDAMKIAVKKHLKQYSSSQQTAVAKILLSQHTGKKAELNLSRPITPEQLAEFVQWWDTTKRKNGQPITRPRNQDSIKSWVEQWLETISQQDNPTKDDYIVIGTEW